MPVKDAIKSGSDQTRPDQTRSDQIEAAGMSRLTGSLSAMLDVGLVVGEFAMREE